MNHAFSFSIKEVSQKLVVGIYVSTAVQNAMQDCPALWQTFGPRICNELTNNIPLSPSGETYGITVMTGPENFNYWAAIEVDETSVPNPSELALPKDMHTLTIPAGLYIKCTVASLAELGEAYQALYTQWPQSQNEYALDMHGLSFELYGRDWQHNSPLEIYAAVTKIN